MAITLKTNFATGDIIDAADFNTNFLNIATFVDALQAGDNFIAGSIETGALAGGAVTEPKIANNAVTLAKLASAVADALVPTGSIIAYAGNTAPSGWLVCDGSGFSQSTYPALYALLNNTAILPDLRERVPMGASGTVAVRTTGGTRKIQLNDLPAHSHPNTIASVTISGTVGVTLAGGSHSHTGTVGTSGSAHDHALPTIRQGPASSAHSGSTTIAAGFSGTDVNLDTGSVGSDHSHNFTGDSANAGVTVSGTSWTQTGGSASITNAPNATTHQDYYQPYYSVNYIIKAA